jgi:hypothetical protein
VLTIGASGSKGKGCALSPPQRQAQAPCEWWPGVTELDPVLS